MNFYLLSLLKLVVILFALLTACAYMVWVERKVLGHIQLRPGPYFVGPHGLLQPLADVIKLVTKEGLLPSYVTPFFYVLAPFLAMALSLVTIVVIPFTPEFELFGVKTSVGLTDLNIAVLFGLAMSGLGVYGVAIGGWASNNKYSLMGGLRGAAQMISYELPLALAIVAPLLIVNTLSYRAIIEAQSGYWLGFLPKWNIFAGPMPQIFSFVIFLIAAFAETNRVPFDLPEAESELVAGFHTEYTSMLFAGYFMSEYINIITICCVATALFLGGWQPAWPVALGSDYAPVALFAAFGLLLLFHGIGAPRGRVWDRHWFPVYGIVFFGLAGLFLVPWLKPIIVPLFWFLAKTGALAILFIWIRGTLPRFRYDQLMRFAWTGLFPLALVNLLVTGLLVAWQG